MTTTNTTTDIHNKVAVVAVEEEVLMEVVGIVVGLQLIIVFN